MKVLLVQHSSFLNGIGGTEKICSELANMLCADGHQAEIATNESTIGFPVFPLHENVTVTNIFDPNLEQKEEIPIYNYKGRNPLLWVKYKLRKKYAKWYNRKLNQRMGGEDKLYQYNLRNRAILWKRYIDRLDPDLIITMSIASLLEITYHNQLSKPIINSVNGRPDYDYTNSLGGRKPYLVDLLTQSFRQLDGIQILFESYRQFLPSIFHGECKVIPNPVQQVPSDKVVNHNQSKKRYKVIHVGRLDSDCKQQHLAIEIFADLASKFPQWELEFWGTGADLVRLNTQIVNLGLSSRIFLRGFTDDPISKMNEADIFIFPSKYEGFGLALGEAMSCGLPSIGFSSCSGVNELIKHGENGFLANSIDEMRSFLKQLMEDAPLRQKLGRQAHLGMKNYTLARMVSGWKTLIQAVMKKHAINKND
ncbi:glycosyltransferase [Sphingobacterium sp. InxBP1]|uniref:glycosyltransferase n=1 Tax=Sphingobacterium sp. InxBP1 TaxID=2870328 RepID=UPI0022439ABC|nr:glycosyltransferase [Sphingobacterium sp. InxBP1]MCW8312122.1 glycosyltransferase [Sphingobacterium sp. InxBP1]